MRIPKEILLLSVFVAAVSALSAQARTQSSCSLAAGYSHARHAGSNGNGLGGGVSFDRLLSSYSSLGGHFDYSSFATAGNDIAIFELSAHCRLYFLPHAPSAFYLELGYGGFLPSIAGGNVPIRGGTSLAFGRMISLKRGSGGILFELSLRGTRDYSQVAIRIGYFSFKGGKTGEFD